MMLHELFATVTWPEVGSRLCALYPDQEKSLGGYKAAFDELRTLGSGVPLDALGEGQIVIVPNTWDEPEPGAPIFDLVDDATISTPQFDVSLVKDDRRFSMAFTEWEALLPLPISPATVALLPPLDIVCHVLFEITFVGYSTAEVKKAADDLMLTAEEAMSETKTNCSASMTSDEFALWLAKQGEENP